MIRFNARTVLSALALAALAGPLAAQTSETTETTEATEAPAEEVQAEEAPAVAETYDADTVVMTVNGIDVTLGYMIAMRQVVVPEQYQSLPGEVLMPALIAQVQQQIVLAEAARKAGLADKGDVQAYLRLRENEVLANAYMREQISAQVNEDVVRAEYDARYANAEQPEEVRAGHILVESLEQAEALKAELDGGADFAALAAEHGTDGTAQRGGDLGWFVHQDMVPEFADAAFAMSPGEISAPVKSPFGYHLIKLEDRRARPVPTFEEVGGQIIQELSTAAQQEILAATAEQAEVVTADPTVPNDAILQDDLLFE